MLLKFKGVMLGMIKFTVPTLDDIPWLIRTLRDCDKLLPLLQEVGESKVFQLGQQIATTDQGVAQIRDRIKRKEAPSPLRGNHKRTKPDRKANARASAAVQIVDRGEVVSTMAESMDPDGSKVVRKAVLLDDLINCVDYAASKLADAPKPEQIGKALRMGLEFSMERVFKVQHPKDRSKTTSICAWSKMRARIKTDLLKNKRLKPGEKLDDDEVEEHDEIVADREVSKIADKDLAFALDNPSIVTTAITFFKANDPNLSLKQLGKKCMAMKHIIGDLCDAFQGDSTPLQSEGTDKNLESVMSMIAAPMFTHVPSGVMQLAVTIYNCINQESCL